MTILLADDHGLFLESVRRWIESETDWHVVTATSHAEVQKRLAGGLQPRIVVLDMNMPGMEGIGAIRALREQWPEIPVLVVSANEDPAAVRACLEAGAAGFVAKSSEGPMLLEAIRDVLKGKSVAPAGTFSALTPRLSGRKLDILRCLAEGLSNRDIARRVHLTEGTVKQYVSEILAELGVDNRVQAAIRAREILGLNS